jgi:nitrogen fixation NifU-like protein
MDLNELYQEVILDHSKAPRNFRVPDPVDRSVEGINPLCGDHFTVFMRVADGVVQDVSFQGNGCAISKASASLMTESLKGKTEAEARLIFDGFHHLVAGEGDAPEVKLGKLKAFEGVRQFPGRVKCAILAWHTAKAALDGDAQEVSTE